MIYITSPAHPIMMETFEKKGLIYRYEPDFNYESLYDSILDAVGIVVSTQIKIDQPMIDQARQLRWIARIGSGMDHIDVSYAESKNIKCISSPEGNSVAVAEHTLGLLLNLLRHINTSSAQIKNNIWLRDENRGFELSGKKVGIIGLGNTGSAFAKLLGAFDVDILAYDKYRAGFGNGKLRESDLNEILNIADVISFHLPLNNETKYFADDELFSKIKSRPILLNTSRGKIMNTAALLKALESNIISGAGLDVLENEQLHIYNDAEKAMLCRLNQMNNVILTPHIAGYSFEAPYKMCRILLEKLGFL